jgi:hypothetical protein
VRNKLRAVGGHHVEKEFEMTSQPASPLSVGLVFEIGFPTFTPRISIHSARVLTVDIVDGDDVSFSDTVEYEAVPLREGLVMLSWQEHIGSTIVHVLDFNSAQAHTAVTPAEGDFTRLTGRFEVKAGA